MRTYDIDSIKKLVEQGYLMVQKHPTADLCIYNYTNRTQYERAWNEHTLAARGLILDSKGVAHSATFNKFFNLGEPSDTKIPLDEDYIVYEKMDGSFLETYWVGDEVFLCTKGHFDFSYTRIAQAILDNKYSEAKKRLKKGVTYIFELIFPAGRIVCDYGDLEDIVLLATFEITTGKEINVEEFQDLGFPVVQGEKFAAGTPFDTLQSRNIKNKEGYVVKFIPSGVRLKIKFDDYLYQHKILTNVSSYDIYDALMERGGLPEELLDRVPDEFYNWVKNMEHSIRRNFQDIQAEAYRTYGMMLLKLDVGFTGGDFAKLAKEQGEYTPLVFSIYNQKKLEPQIWKMVKPAHEKPFQFRDKQIAQLLAQEGKKNVRETEGLENPTVEEGRGVRTRESGENPGV